MKRMGAGLLVWCLLCMPSSTAEAFCGFYVSGADAQLFNNATQVVLMRKGRRTVMSMQNDYQGPPKDFAMVVPVPVVLQEENVKTLPKAIFDKVDKLAAPRLVEYWEQDPCAPPRPVMEMARRSGVRRKRSSASRVAAADLGVTVEAEFTVGEYEVVILSAKESGGLDKWLRLNKYKIPSGAEPLLRPYVAQGSKFFVAKVNIKKVKFRGGHAALSPLRFHFDTDKFVLPVRLGMINSSGTQDLIVHILSPGQRYEVANYANANIPSNLEVKNAVRKRFGEFYAALFDDTLQKSGGAVITEYAWDSATCDPCPSPPLTPQDLMTLGADVIGAGASGRPGSNLRRRPRGMVLTRLHARYDKGSISDDLVFAPASPIMGGREVRAGSGDGVEQGAKPSGSNNFQGRYIIRHRWKGAIKCDSPQRGIWGGPPQGGKPPSIPAVGTAFVRRGALKLTSVLNAPLPAPSVTNAKAAETEGKPVPPPVPAAEPDPGPTGPRELASPPKALPKATEPVQPEAPASALSPKSKGCHALGGTPVAWWWLGALWLWRRRRAG